MASSRGRGSSPGPARVSASAAASVAAESVPVAAPVLPPRRNSFSVGAPLGRPRDTVGIEDYPSIQRLMKSFSDPTIFSDSDHFVYSFFKVNTFDELYQLLMEIQNYLSSGVFNFEITFFLNNMKGTGVDDIPQDYYIFYGKKIGTRGEYLGTGFTIYTTKDKKLINSFFELSIVNKDKINVFGDFIPSETICRSKSLCTLQGGSRKRRSKKRRSKKRKSLRKKI